VTVFCPNCGTPNTDEATACAKCGTALKAAGPKVAPSKFKGTMMMSGVTPPRPQAPGAGLPPPAAPAPAAAPPAAAPESKQNLAFQATMLGPMTPPPGMPSAFGATTPAAGGGFGTPPPATDAGFGAPPPAASGGFGAPPPAASGGFGAPAASDAGFGASPAGGGGFGTPPAGGGFGAPPAGGGGFGAPPAGGGGFGEPPAGGGFGAPPAGGGFGAPPAGGGGGPAPKKNNTLKYVGIGCGALLLLSCLCGIGVNALSIYRERAAQAGLEGAAPAMDTSTGIPAAGSDATATAGGTCARTKACCEAIYSQPIFQGQGMQACAAVDQVAGTPFAETACTAQLDAFRQAAANLPGGLPAICK
jgi:hypothetical protein